LALLLQTFFGFGSAGLLALKTSFPLFGINNGAYSNVLDKLEIYFGAMFLS